MEEREKRDNLSPILYFEICYTSGSISSFFVSPHQQHCRMKTPICDYLKTAFQDAGVPLEHL